MGGKRLANSFFNTQIVMIDLHNQRLQRKVRGHSWFKLLNAIHDINFNCEKVSMKRIGGVSDVRYVAKPSIYRSPLAAIYSSSAISSGVCLSARAPMFCLMFSILVVPGMGTTSFPWW